MPNRRLVWNSTHLELCQVLLMVVQRLDECWCLGLACGVGVWLLAAEEKKGVPS
jgi:hypothetical protein